MAQPSNSCNQQAVPSSLLSAILPQQHQGRQLLQGTPKSVDSQSSQRGHCRNGLPCRLGERAAVGRSCKRTCTSLTSIKSYLSSTLMIVSHASEEFEKFLGSWQEGAWKASSYVNNNFYIFSPFLSCFSILFITFALDKKGISCASQSPLSTKECMSLKVYEVRVEYFDFY